MTRSCVTWQHRGPRIAVLLTVTRSSKDRLFAPSTYEASYSLTSESISKGTLLGLRHYMSSGFIPRYAIPGERQLRSALVHKHLIGKPLRGFFWAELRGTQRCFFDPCRNESSPITTFALSSIAWWRKNCPAWAQFAPSLLHNMIDI
jgi:hypothetical protein